MDLQGSLVDTNLRIQPSIKLIEFLKTLPIDDNVPINIIKLVKGNDYELKNIPKVEDTLKVSIHLNSKDIDNLNKIKATFTEDIDIKDDEEESIQKHSKIELSNESKSNEVKHSETESSNTNSTNSEKANDKTNETKKDCNKETKKSKEECNEKLKEKNHVKDDVSDEKEICLTTSDIDWLYDYLQKSKAKGQSVPYLYQLLDGGDIKMPENKVIKRNPELEARCVKLRAQQEAREYRKMTKSVDNVRMRFPEDSISFQLKQVNRHLIAIGQFIISIFAGFLFGFKGVEWMIGSLDFGFRLLLGVMCALIISLAEIYFLAKKLNEELNIPETVQLGGPPKFADQQNYYDEKVKSKAIEKEHQD